MEVGRHTQIRGVRNLLPRICPAQGGQKKLRSFSPPPFWQSFPFLRLARPAPGSSSRDASEVGCPGSEERAEGVWVRGSGRGVTEPALTCKPARVILGSSRCNAHLFRGLDLNTQRSSRGPHTNYSTRARSLQGSLPAPHACWPRTFRSRSEEHAGPFPPRPPVHQKRGTGRPWTPPPPPAERAAKAGPRGSATALDPPASEPLGPEWQSALGPSASPHVAPPRAALPLAVAGPSGPAGGLSAGRTARRPGAGSEVNSLE